MAIAPKRSDAEIAACHPLDTRDALVEHARTPDTTSTS